MWIRFFACLLLPFSLFAQNGDKPGEKQTPLVPPDQIPPAPVLAPADALKSFKLVPGFKIELVAAEPLVHQPVAMEFDPDGRIWVVEMQGFMPNADGQGENEPVGTISILEDTDHDGRMDRRTVFIDKLVMPRSLLLVKDGLLVAEPPRLWFYPNEGGKAGDRVEVAPDYAREADPALGLRANPEHTANSLFWAMDNWVYSANYTTRFRYTADVWKREPTAFRGQWGLSQDDSGRLIYNSNSDQFRIDLVPSRYLSRNPNYRNAAGINVDPIHDQNVWPARVTPGINRGYQAQMLRDGKLAQFTAACGPVIYRGDQFPAEFRGNAFVCEPSANLVKRNILIEKNGVVTGHQAYTNSEFLASTDERFRPINAYNGPDGALYIVDMYHGIIQHRVFLTSYLRKQSESRGLDKPSGLGRIYRITAENHAPAAQPQLSKAPLPELVGHLSHPNGWWRDTAQRLLVLRNESASVVPLQKLAASGPSAVGRRHALWTLEGMDRLDPGTIRKSFGDADAGVKATAIRLSEPFLKTDSALTAEVLRLTGDTRPEVQLQLALTLGEIDQPSARAAMMTIASRASDQLYIRDALLTGLGGHELETLELALGNRVFAEKRFSPFLGGLAKCVFNERKTNRVSRLLQLAAGAPSVQQTAILEGISSLAPVAARGKPPPKVKLIYFANEPEGYAVMMSAADDKKRGLLEKIGRLITWPGQPGYVPLPPVQPLTEAQKQQFELGKSFFSASCAACHQPTGLGQEGLAPPLLDSEWVLGSENRLIRIALQGVHGSIGVKGKTYEMEMPGLPIFDDEQIAAILTYIRREWEHTAAPVAPESVKKIRDATAQRETAWTEAELQAIP